MSPLILFVIAIVISISVATGLFDGDKKKWCFINY